MHIAVFGSCGFIGQNLVQHLRRSGHACLGLDIAKDSGESGSHTLIDISRNDIDLPRGLDAVVYLAQSPDYRCGRLESVGLFEVNTIGPLRAAAAAAKSGCDAFFYASTGNVYTPSFDPLSELCPTNGGTPYALSKLMGEQILQSLSNELRIVCLRFFGVYGPHQRGMLVPNIMDRIWNGRPIEIAPNPKNAHDADGLKVSLSHVDDAVAAITYLLQIDGGTPLPPILNIGGSEGVSIRKLADLAAGLLQKPALKQLTSDPRLSNLIADIDLLQTTVPTDFRPIDRGLEDVALAYCKSKIDPN